MIYSTGMYQYSELFNGIEKGNIENEPTNKDFWAFSYVEDERVTNFKRASNFIFKPVKGRIVKEHSYIYFYEYEMNGRDLQKNGVLIRAGYFADTYEEAVKGFNVLVQRRIDSLTKEIKKLQDMLIK